MDALVATEAEAAQPAGEEETLGGFAVSLANFQGPFDLLLNLIASKDMDVTQVALAEVTDEFLAYTFRLGEDGAPGEDQRSEEERLEERSSFLVVAATLLDWKAARLLPSADVESQEDIEALEARDLLFAKLLQYEAFKKASAYLKEELAVQSRSFPREVRKGEGFEDLLPPLAFNVSPELLAQLAQAALSRPAQPEAEKGVNVEHLHGNLHGEEISLSEEVAEISRRLSDAGGAKTSGQGQAVRLSFAELCEDARSCLHVVVRFLAILELYRRSSIHLEQEGETIWAQWSVMQEQGALAQEKIAQEKVAQEEAEER